MHIAYWKAGLAKENGRSSIFTFGNTHDTSCDGTGDCQPEITSLPEDVGKITSHWLCRTSPSKRFFDSLGLASIQAATSGAHQSRDPSSSSSSSIITFISQCRDHSALCLKARRSSSGQQS